MKVSKKGYQYSLPIRRKDGNQIVETGDVHEVTFLETDAEGNTVTEGCFTEDVLKMLIDRQDILNAKLASPEGEEVIGKLQEALALLGRRQQDRKDRGVHMTHQK